MKIKVKVLVVDDSAYSRQTIKKMLESDPLVEVIGIATDGIDAIAKTLRLKPDLITLDFEMPEMDGFSFLRWLMSQAPTPVIMVSSYSDSKTVFRALELGAVDFIAKPTKRATIELKNIEKDLLAKVRGVKSLNMDVLSKNLRLLESTEKEEDTDRPYAGTIDLVAIAASTGGPAALQIILTKLPSDFGPGIVISQHMPKGFTKPLAERLNKLAQVNIKEAEDGDTIEEGSVYICPGGAHMSFRKRGSITRISLKDAAYEDKYIPSADIMMKSAAEHFGRTVMGVVLTGMGNDGREGMLEIKSKGGYTIAESDETAVVYGMPYEVVKAGAANKVLPLQEIPAEMVRVIRTRR